MLYLAIRLLSAAEIFFENCPASRFSGPILRGRRLISRETYSGRHISIGIFTA
jgi:hypothetical protein